MIENNIYKILEWDSEKGEILNFIESNSPILKMIIEPQNDHLFILISKEKKSILELFSFKNKVFISLSDAEDENPENFFFLRNGSHDVCFKRSTSSSHPFCNICAVLVLMRS